MARAVVGACAVALGAALLPAGAAAQQGAPADVPVFASPFLSVDHWAAEALRRLRALGALPAGVDPATGSLTRRTATLSFAAAAAGDDPEAARLGAAYLDLLSGEFPATMAALEPRAARTVALLAASVIGGADARNGAVSTGAYTADGWRSPLRLADRAEATVAGDAAAAVFPHLSISAAARWTPGALALESGEAQVVVGPVAMWAGRRATGYRAEEAGGVVLSGTVAFDGGGVFLPDPVRLPWVFGALGPVTFESTLSRLDRNGDIRHPWLWTARGTVHPHPRVSIGVTRGMFIGGEENEPLTLRGLAYALFGKQEEAFNALANSVVAVDVAYRTASPVPLSLYFDWGAEDSAGAWFRSPGQVFGFFLPALPGAPLAYAGVERARFIGGRNWYRHSSFHDGWASHGVLLGHPLGGEGTEWRAYAGAAALDARLRVRGAAFVRERGAENVYAPERQGGSHGGDARVQWRSLDHLELSGTVDFEWGDGWSCATASIGGHLLFAPSVPAPPGASP